MSSPAGLNIYGCQGGYKYFVPESLRDIWKYIFRISLTNNEAKPYYGKF